ncbi:MAG: hypothetical protein KH009_02350 [Clostridiales bacterium]|nr:hypothetical protein [Clostridiales bacterium]
MPYLQIRTSGELTREKTDRLHTVFAEMMAEVLGAKNVMMEFTGGHRFYYAGQYPEGTAVEVHVMERFTDEQYSELIRRSIQLAGEEFSQPAEQIVVNVMGLPTWGANGKALHI